MSNGLIGLNLFHAPLWAVFVSITVAVAASCFSFDVTWNEFLVGAAPVALFVAMFVAIIVIAAGNQLGAVIGGVVGLEILFASFSGYELRKSFSERPTFVILAATSAMGLTFGWLFGYLTKI